MRQVIGAACVLVLATGCSGSKEETRSDAPAAPLTAQEARGLVAALEAEQARQDANDPLANPRSIDDVVAILKRDDLHLFQKGVAFADKDGSPQAKHLAAQIELADGDAHLIMAHLFSDAATRLRQSVRTLRSRGLFFAASPAEQQEVAQMEKTAAQCDRMAEALTVLAYDHLTSGAKRAQALVEANPTDYHGYRVAADYYRLRQDWKKFDEMIAGIEKTNPTSNGLIFQRGAAALQRDNKPDEAAQILRGALEKDPQFTRAQVFVLMSRTDPVETYREYEKLKQLNPTHQVVLWAGPAIVAAYNARIAALNSGAAGSPVPNSGVNDPLNRNQRTPQ